MSFLQSSEWEQFQNLLGRSTWRIDGVLLIRHDLPGGFNYLYCPRPELVTRDWLAEVGAIARRGKSIFLKIDPAHGGQVSGVRCQVSDSLQPRKTAILNLQQSEDELLSAMHEKTRYNIRLAERRGVQIANRQPQTEPFWELLRETAKRDKFYVHPREHYEKLLSMRSPNFSDELFFVEYNGKVVAAALINFYKDTATYLHGASSGEHREVMAPHLLHWRIIQEAKRRGCEHYDLWGIDENKWPGVTRFKLGFGGSVVEYPESVDIIYRPTRYLLYSAARQLF